MMIARNGAQNLIASLRGWASGRVVLLLFILTTAVYLVMLLVTIPRVQSRAPDMRLFDLSPTGYSHEQAMSLLSALGPEGRESYLFPQLALDFIYPGLLAISLSLTLIWVYSKRGRSDRVLFYIILLPVLAGLCDYGENLLIVRMIAGFPDVSKNLVCAASAFTVLKSFLTTGCFVLLLVGFALLLRRRTIPSVPDDGRSAGPGKRRE